MTIKWTPRVAMAKQGIFSMAEMGRRMAEKGYPLTPPALHRLQGGKSGEPPKEIKLATLNALLDALDLVGDGGAWSRRTNFVPSVSRASPSKILVRALAERRSSLRPESPTPWSLTVGLLLLVVLVGAGPAPSRYDDMGPTFGRAAQEEPDTRTLAACDDLQESPEADTGPASTPLRAIAVEGAYAYVGVASKLVILDVTDPAHVLDVGQSAPLPDMVRAIVVSGGHAFVALGRAGVYVLDVSDPSRPLVASCVRLATDSADQQLGAGEMTLGDGRLYVRVIGRAYNPDDAGFGVAIFDVSDPIQPRQLAYVNTAISGRASHYGYRHGFIGRPGLVASLLYLGVGSPGGNAHLVVLDVADPVTPVQVSELHLSDVRNLGLDVHVAGDTALVGALWLVDVSDPTAPQTIPWLHAATGATEASGPPRRGAGLAPGRAYFPVRNPTFAAPWRVAAVDLADRSSEARPGFIETAERVDQVLAQGSRVYLLTNRRLHIVDWADPTQPAELGVYEVP